MSPSSLDLDIGAEDGSDEDSIFVPFADLFSLLSLTVIYVVLTFGQMVPNASEPVVVANMQGSGPGKPIDPAAAYVSLMSDGNAVRFYVTRSGNQLDLAVPLRGADTKVPEDWLRETISRGSKPSTIYVYLPPSENDVVIKALFTDVHRFVRANFENVRLAL
jgi:hypothetical protein